MEEKPTQDHKDKKETTASTLDFEDEAEFTFEDKGTQRRGLADYLGGNPEDDEFDAIVGALQDVMLEEEFEELQTKFFEENYEIFEDNEVNKFEYTPIHMDYRKNLEQHIE